MTRLTDFRNNTIDNNNNEETLKAMEAAGLKPDLVQTKVIFADAPVIEKKKEDASLRSQMLRWYNANPDMFEVGVNNAIRTLNEQLESKNAHNFVVKYKGAQGSLSTQPENLRVNDITFLEDFLFFSYPLLSKYLTFGRVEGQEIERLVIEDLEKLSIFQLVNELVERTRKRELIEDRMDYADTLNVLTC